jgi:chorismate mutase/prephenate dehydratase
MAIDLLVLRDQIDAIDKQIVALYEERMEICKDVAAFKIETGKQVFDKAREDEKIQKVRSLATGDFNKCAVEELFQQIMSISRKMQYQLLEAAGVTNKLSFAEIKELATDKAKVVFQGAEGAYSYAAMNEYFGDEVDSFHVDSFREAMDVLEEGRADFAVLPIENSTAGIVSEIYDLLTEYDNYIVGEQIIQIEHCLMAIKGTKMEDIERVYSHPQSLMQTANYLRGKNWQQISMQNNAFAAKYVKETGLTNQAAIASETAAKIYGLEILEKGVNDLKGNSTRFIIVSNQKVFRENAEKISICFELNHTSGSLYHMLSHFIYNGLNMTKIESRPIEDRNWEYRFFIDFEGNLKDSAVKNALRGIREEARNLKILGNY